MDNNSDPRNWKVGDILDATFHYSMAIPKFYIVVRNTGKTIFAEKIGRKEHSSDAWGQSGTMVPDPDKRSGKIEKRRICSYTDSAGELVHYARFNDSYTKKWDGKPVDYYGD